MRKFAVALTLAALALAPGTALAKGGGGGGGSRGGGGFSSGSKSSGGSSKSAGGSSAPKTSSSGAKSYSSSKSSIRQPSSGPVKQPAPVTRLVPPKPFTPSPTARPGSFASKYGVPAGRNYNRDRTFIVTHREYANPYYGSYYGGYNSPFFYMWYGSLLDGDGHNNAALPQADEGQIALILPTEFKVVAEAVK